MTMNPIARNDDDTRPVVTGLGVVAANGIGVDAFWESLLAGRSGVAPITLFDASNLRTRIAAEVKGYDPLVHLPAGAKWKRMARHTRFALTAMREAIEDAGLADGSLTPAHELFISMGVSTSAIELVELAANGVFRNEPERIPPWLVGSLQPNGVTAALAAHLGTRVSLTTTSTACQAGLAALWTAAEAIRSRRCEIVLAGGTDAPITPATCASFNAGRMLSLRNDDPTHASRPFDRDRDGGLLGEGAGMMVVESLAHARARGARPWVELCGGANWTDPPGVESGQGLGLCMQRALANARMRPEEIDYVCAHGPSDPLLDRVETAMIRDTFGRHAFHIPVSSIKGVTGNALSAAGPLELAACALAMRHNRIPPTANYRTADPECDLDYVPQARVGRIERALMNVHGMGGGNTSMVVRNLFS